jgi:hypothetical protein
VSYEEYEEEEEAHERPGEDVAPGMLTSMSLAFLAMLPMLAAYEWGLSQDPDAARNAGERVLGLSLSMFGGFEDTARRAGLALCGLLALYEVRRMGGRVRAGVSRIVLEGLVAAALLGPLLVVLTNALGKWVEPLDATFDRTGGAAPELARAALLLGGSAWEELLFRVGAYSFLFWLALRFCTAIGFGAGTGRLFAEAAGLLGSAAIFALAHLDPVLGFLGEGGQAFEPSLFTWLLLAGLLLGLLFRWRGPGVAAWAHGLFNVALLLGVDPEVVL